MAKDRNKVLVEAPRASQSLSRTLLVITTFFLVPSGPQPRLTQQMRTHNPFIVSDLTNRDAGYLGWLKDSNLYVIISRKFILVSWER